MAYLSLTQAALRAYHVDPDDEHAVAAACKRLKRLADAGVIAHVKVGVRGDRWLDADSLAEWVNRGRVEHARRLADQARA